MPPQQTKTNQLLSLLKFVFHLNLSLDAAENVFHNYSNNIVTISVAFWTLYYFVQEILTCTNDCFPKYTDNSMDNEFSFHRLTPACWT